MNGLNEIIKDYLESPSTDYAIMICGVWGCGKSFYIHHDFKDLVKTVTVPKKEGKQKEKTYNPAFISLYGVSSAEDFEYRVFCGINSWAEKGIIRLGSNIIAKGASLLGIELSKKDTASVTFVNEDRVLVFDDLERICEDKIPVKEVLGLINSYAEHTHRKVIIVCNEESFLESEKVSEDYTKYKEKSVRFTYSFEPDESAAYDAMCNDVQDREYKEYLNSNKDSILAVFRLGGNKNLRTLKFFVDTFGKIYNEVSKSKHATKLIRNYMVALMLYSIEHKKGVSIDDLLLLDESRFKIDDMDLFGLHKQEESIEVNKDYSADFRETYNVVYADFVNSKALLDYITTGAIDKSSLKKQIKELEDRYDKEQGTEEGRLYNKLNNISTLSDEEVKPLLDQLYEFIRADKYNIYDLLYIYTLFLKYNYWHFCGFEITPEIDQMVLSSMERQKEKHIYNSLFEYKTPIWDSSLESRVEYEKYSAIKSVASKINREARMNNEVSECNQFIRVAEKGDVNEMRQYRMDVNNRLSVNGMDWDRVGELILALPNPSACELCECIIFLTPDAALVSISEQERIKEKLIPVLETYMDDKRGLLRDMYVNELVRHLKGVVR